MRKPKGTRDFLPKESRKIEYVKKVFIEAAKSYGFEEIIMPTFEKTSLYSRGVGDETDVVKKEMFQVISSANIEKYCKGEYNLKKDGLTLRPEGTAGAARLLIENKEYISLPKKYFYITTNFRNERPQAGRFREFTQLGIEVFGVKESSCDIYVLLLFYNFIKKLGLKNTNLKINSIGCPKCRPSFHDALKSFIKPKLKDLCSDCNNRFDTNPLRIIDCKVEKDKEAIKGHPVSTDFLCSECQSNFNDVINTLNSLNIEYEIDNSIVRGLDYYSKMAFEMHTDMKGSISALGGGGRYDDLVSTIGGPSVPGVGFAFGLDRIVIAMESQNLFDNIDNINDIYFISIGETKAKAFEIFEDLRKNDYKIEFELNNRSLRSALKYADKQKFKFVLILGEEELKEEKIIFKDMINSKQELISWDNIKGVLNEN